MASVVHISPHLGGGVGKVVLNHLQCMASAKLGWTASLRCLESANGLAVRRAKDSGIDLRDRCYQDLGALLAEVASADLVLVHWWNHPLLYALFSSVELPQCRLAIWSHVSGIAAPQLLTPAVVDFVDLCVLATPHSLAAPAIKSLDEGGRQDKVRVVFTSGGTEDVADVVPAPHRGIVIGYVGTVDYCKLHREFLSMSAAVKDSAARFVICGGDRHVQMRAEARELGVGDRFQFLGPVADVSGQLAQFDVFGYPLQRTHYGTGEQALIEALAAGVPPVVFGGGAESVVVRDGTTGLVVDSPQQYTSALEHLASSPMLRARLSRNGRKDARERFSVESTSRAWVDVMQEMVTRNKRLRRWTGAKCSAREPGAGLFVGAHGSLGAQWAMRWAQEGRLGPIAGKGGGDDPIAEHQELQRFASLFETQTRGSAFHYLRTFPSDDRLQQWCTWWSEQVHRQQERTL